MVACPRNHCLDTLREADLGTPAERYNSFVDATLGALDIARLGWHPLEHDRIIGEATNEIDDLKHLGTATPSDVHDRTGCNS